MVVIIENILTLIFEINDLWKQIYKGRSILVGN